jgi:hypothetical protein
MRTLRTGLVAALAALAFSPIASAQTADEVIEKSIAALGGRAAHAKIKTRRMTGSIVLGTPAGDIKGSIEVTNAMPNKTRSVIKADLSALGAGELTVDQRFDGTSGYVLDSLQGNRDMMGSQLDAARNTSFPHPFLNYKDLGIAAKLAGKEKVGDREAFVILFDPTSGPEIRNYIDAETFMPVRSVTRVDVPQLGQEIEQTIDLLDYKEVDGIKIPFRLRASSSVQSLTISADKVEHNVTLDDTLFSKPK